MSNHYDNYEPDQIEINPATGLPLVKDTYTDVGGSPYGYDAYQQPWTPSPSYDTYSSGVEVW